MSIMNRASDGSSPLLLVLWRALRTLRITPKDALLAFCVPESLEEKEGRARKTLTRWVQLGLFGEEDGKVRVNPPFDAIESEKDPEFWAFRHSVRRLVLRPEANAEFLCPEPSGAADFTFACAWLLSSDVYGPQLGSARTVEAYEGATLEGGNSAKFAIQNPTRWDGFREWASFVGFASNTSSFQLDPGDAVEFELHDLLTDEPTSTITEAVHHLGKRIPVLDGGEYSVLARQRAKAGWRQIANHEVSPALSRALLRMEAAGQIMLTDRSDAEHRIFLGRGFRELRQVSHIEKVKGWS